jgi:hypothetical protein
MATPTTRRRAGATSVGRSRVSRRKSSWPSELFVRGHGMPKAPDRRRSASTALRHAARSEALATCTLAHEAWPHRPSHDGSRWVLVDRPCRPAQRAHDVAAPAQQFDRPRARPAQLVARRCDRDSHPPELVLSLMVPGSRIARSRCATRRGSRCARPARKRTAARSLLHGPFSHGFSRGVLPNRVAAVSRDRKAPHCGAFSSAPKRTRTSTGLTSHKALNLARLPIPPPAQVGSPGRWSRRRGRV